MKARITGGLFGGLAEADSVETPAACLNLCQPPVLRKVEANKPASTSAVCYKSRVGQERGGLGGRAQNLHMANPPVVVGEVVDNGGLVVVVDGHAGLHI